MNYKSRNFFLINFIEKFFKQNKNILFLFIHVNDLSTHETTELNCFSKNNSIDILNVKKGLYQKMIKNSIFLNILNGPTRIFKFSNFSSLVNFLDNKTFEKKLIPLLIYWNFNFYNCDFFYNYLNSNIKTNLHFIENLSQINNKSLFLMKNFQTNLIIKFNYLNIVLLLNILLNKLK